MANTSPGTPNLSTVAPSAGIARNEQVSFEDELLILVDEDDQEVGFLDKNSCHNGAGKLHRAFSLFVFNDAGEVLLQQRSAEKRLWPMYWSNSCCSHPRKGETMAVATSRRLQQELGLTAELSFLYKFEYTANFQNLGSEHELCWVYCGQAQGQLSANEQEVNDYRWISVADFDAELAATPYAFTPWCAMEWQRLRTDFADQMTT